MMHPHQSLASSVSLSVRIITEMMWRSAETGSGSGHSGTPGAPSSRSTVAGGEKSAAKNPVHDLLDPPEKTLTRTLEQSLPDKSRAELESLNFLFTRVSVRISVE